MRNTRKFGSRPRRSTYFESFCLAAAACSGCANAGSRCSATLVAGVAIGSNLCMTLPYSINGVRPHFSSERESFVSARRNLVAFLDVLRKSEQRHEYAGLSRDVRAQVPRVALRIDGSIGDRIDVRDPRVLGRN